MKKPVEPDGEFEAFLQQESREVDEILASLDRTKDVLYIQFHDAEVTKTVELAEDELLVDLDEHGDVLGIEVLRPGIQGDVINEGGD